MRRIRLAVFTFSLLSCVAAPALAQPRLSTSTGFDHSKGDYGQSADTEVVSVPFSVRLTEGDWSARVSISHLEITGPADVADIAEGGDGGAPGGAGAPVARMGAERGFGDTSISVTRSFRRLRGSDAYFDAFARVRLPTGDDARGLGVGVTDYAAGGELGVSTRGGGGYVSVSRRFLGNRAETRRRDGWQASVGGWLNSGGPVTVGANLYWREASIEGPPDPVEISANISYRLNASWRVTAHAGRGLSEASPNVSTGMRLTWRAPLRD